MTKKPEPPGPAALVEALRALRGALDEVRPDDAEDAIGRLSNARRLLDEALDEAMALATLSGASVRSVARAAGIAPNTVTPRLGRTRSLGSYSGSDGRVDSGGLYRARGDAAQGRYQPAPQPPTVAQPLRFRRRDNKRS